MPKLELTIPQAAARLGYSRQRVFQLVKDGYIKAHLLGRQYIVTEIPDPPTWATVPGRKKERK